MLDQISVVADYSTTQLTLFTGFMPIYDS